MAKKQIEIMMSKWLNIVFYSFNSTHAGIIGIITCYLHDILEFGITTVASSDH